MMSQRAATAISSFGRPERATSEPAEEAFITSEAPPHGFLNGEAKLTVHENLLLLLPPNRPWPECVDLKKPILINKFDYPYFLL
jgi:hypothetical protein